MTTGNGILHLLVLGILLPAVPSDSSRFGAIIMRLLRGLILRDPVLRGAFSGSFSTSQFAWSTGNF